MNFKHIELDTQAHVLAGTPYDVGTQVIQKYTLPVTDKILAALPSEQRNGLMAGLLGGVAAAVFCQLGRDETIRMLEASAQAFRDAGAGELQRLEGGEQ